MLELDGRRCPLGVCGGVGTLVIEFLEMELRETELVRWSSGFPSSGLAGGVLVVPRREVLGDVPLELVWLLVMEAMALLFNDRISAGLNLAT